MMTRCAILLFASALCATCQHQDNRVLTFDNGIQVVYQTFISDVGRYSSLTDHKGHEIRRTITGPGRVVGFSISIELDPPGFIVRLTPSGPDDLPKEVRLLHRVQDGGRIVIPLLLDHDGSLLIFDTLQMGRLGTLMQLVPMPRGAPRLASGEMSLSLKDPVFVHEASGFRYLSIGDYSSSAIVLPIPGYGVFTLSTRSFAGAKLEGVVDQKRILFVSDNDSYAITSSVPLLPAGSWLVWVKHDRASKALGFRIPSTPQSRKE